MGLLFEICIVDASIFMTGGVSAGSTLGVLPHWVGSVGMVSGCECVIVFGRRSTVPWWVVVERVCRLIL